MAHFDADTSIFEPANCNADRDTAFDTLDFATAQFGLDRSSSSADTFKGCAGLFTTKSIGDMTVLPSMEWAGLDTTPTPEALYDWDRIFDADAMNSAHLVVPLEEDWSSSSDSEPQTPSTVNDARSPAATPSIPDDSPPTQWSQEYMFASMNESAATRGEAKGSKPRGKNKKPVFWTPDEHAKFVKGLEQFGLQDGLGHGGAELMSVYMGNRSVLQVKSHMQKYIAERRASRRMIQ